MYPVTEVLLRQIYFTGVQALPLITISALFIGVIIVIQTVSITGAGSATTVGKILLWLILREISPFFTSLIILTRSGSAISTELATMKLHGEIEYIEAMGIKTEKYLIQPRLNGAVVSSVILSLYFQILAIFGGVFVAAVLTGTSFSDYTDAIIAQISLNEFLLSILKSFLFGFFISTICIWQGLSVKKSPTEIPQRATKAVTGGLFSLFFLDVLIDLSWRLIE